MGKKNYIKPVLKTEEFVPQEYCAMCEPECGDGLDRTQYIVYKDVNHNGRFDRRSDIRIANMTPCFDEDLDKDELPMSFPCMAQKYEGRFPNGQAFGPSIPVTCWPDPEPEHNWHIVARHLSNTSKS